MKCMVSYIQWYHQEFDTNGNIKNQTNSSDNLNAETSTLLRTGASMGNPYSYSIKVIIKKY